MKRRTKFNITAKHIYITTLILLSVLILLSYLFQEELAPVKSSVGNVISPMQKGINTVGKSISNQWDKFASMNELMEENELLKEQVSNLSSENKMMLQDQFELNRLRELYKLDEKYSEYPKVAARVIAANPNNFFTSFTIDKGTEDGIQVDMNVLAGSGLVGIIEEVGTNWAQVKTIIDDSSKVSAMFLKTSDTCIVHGNLELMNSGVIGVESITSEAEIEEGFEIVTSHISDKYLQGISIGYVKDITIDPNRMTKSAHLVPVVNFEKLEEVLIITELKEKIDKPTN